MVGKKPIFLGMGIAVNPAKVFARRVGSDIRLTRSNVRGLPATVHGHTHEEFAKRAVGEVVSLSPATQEIEFHWPNGQRETIKLNVA
mgnify:FL=1